MREMVNSRNKKERSVVDSARKPRIIRKARIVFVGLLAVAMTLAGGAFGGLEASAVESYEWGFYSSGTGAYDSGRNIGTRNGPISLGWDSSTVFSVNNDYVKIYPASNEGLAFMGKLKKDDVFSKSGYVYKGAAISDRYDQVPTMTEYTLYHSAVTAVSKQETGCTYRIQPIMLKTYYYDYNYSGGGSASVTNDINFTDGSIYYTLDTSANQAMFNRDPERAGYTFAGWYTSPNGGSKVNAYSTDNQTTLYAHWTANSYNLSLINGSGINSVSGSGSYQHGSSVTISASVGAGYHFTGWSGTYSSSANPYTFTMPAGNVTLTANAAPNTHSLSFVVDGRVVSSNGSVPYGAKVSDYAPSISGKTGYTFSGWNGMPVSMPDQDVTVTGTYQANSYNITFISEGRAVKSTSIRYGDTISSVVPSVSRQGYRFDGWYSSAEGGSLASLTGTYQKAGDTIVYAHWTPLYQYNASDNTFYIYSKDPSVINQWKNDSIVLGARKIVLGREINRLEALPLSGFTNLEEITVDSNNGAFASAGGLLYSRNWKELIFCPARHADDPSISEECVTVKADAFSGTNTVNKVVLPYSIQTLEENAFNTSSIKEISMKSFEMEIGDNSINTSTKLKVFQGSAGETYAQERNLTYSLYTEIGNGFFEGTDMASFVVPDNITAIGNEAFRSCTKLSRIIIPASVKSIGSHAFAGDTLVESLDLSGVEMIGENAFSGMAGLTKVVLSEQIRTLGPGAFRGCASLNQIFVDNMTCEVAPDPNTIPKSVVVQCYAGSTAEAYAAENGNPMILMAGFEKDGVTDYVAGNSAALIVEVKMGDYLKSIGDHAFAGAQLREVVLPPGVETIEEGVFAGCVTLESVDFSKSSVKVIPKDAFHGCTNLKEIAFGQCERIETSAFEGCTSFESVSLPDSVTEIGENTFKGCSGLTKISVENQNCAIFDSQDTFPAQAEVDAYTNSTGNVYAEKFKRQFTSIGNSYIVSFDTQGGSGGTADIYAVNGKKLPEICIPEKKGWVFGGYFSSVEGGGVCYYNEKGVSVREWDLTDGKLLYAMWRPESHTVFFHAAGGISEESISLKTGETFGTLPTATRENYIFLGWYTELEGGDPVTEMDVMGETDVTLYAHWSEKLMQNLVPDGFMEGNEEIREVSIPKGVTTISKDAFLGCSKLEKISIPDTVTTIEEGAFAGCGLRVVTLPRSVKEVGKRAFADCPLLEKVFVWNKDCHFFDRRDTFSNGVMLAGMRASSTRDYAGKYHFDFAQCGMSYEVSFDADGGSNLQNALYAYENEVLKATVKVPRKEGYVFLGYNAEGTLLYGPDGQPAVHDYQVKSDLHLKAQWKKADGQGTEENPGPGASQKPGTTANPEPGVSQEPGTSANPGEGASQQPGASGKPGQGNSAKPDASGKPGPGATPEPGASGKPKPGNTEKPGTDIILPGTGGTSGIGVPQEPGTDENPGTGNTGKPGTTAKPGIDSSQKPGATVKPGTGISSKRIAASTLSKGNGKKKGSMKGSTDTVGNLKYKVGKSGKKKGQVSVVGVKNKKVRKVSIPAKVKIRGTTFPVTEVSAGAFRGCKKLKYISLGRNIRIIGSKSFYHDRKLKQVLIKSGKLKVIGKHAFQGIEKKAVIRRPESRRKAYRKLLSKKAGITKNMRIRKLTK